ncbi:hypothetical protein RIF29_29772 [Crotalaria pallida]|uniref:NOG1 N-terminal helical domain-containing protein n=1 Tax=Crotalaria pallida TaxID=3830 RepID=A0AAN9HXR3_CROPI
MDTTKRHIRRIALQHCIVLGKVDALRKRVVSVGKEHASLCAKSTSKREAEERLSEGLKKIEEIFAQERKIVDDLIVIAKAGLATGLVGLRYPPHPSVHYTFILKEGIWEFQFMLFELNIIVI